MITLKIKGLQILLLGICVVSLIVVWLGYNWLSNPDNTFEIKLSKGYTQSIDFSDLNLVPGESKKYDVDLVTTISGESELEFTFEKSGESPLAEFLYFEIKIGDKVLCDTSLNNLLDGHTVRYTADMTIGEPLNVDIRCYMPETVTNEAQGKTANIKLNITASNEKPIGE